MFSAETNKEYKGLLSAPTPAALKKGNVQNESVRWAVSHPWVSAVFLA
jgi:hypothetical protein